MGNGVSRSQVTTRTVYLEVEGREQKVILSLNYSSFSFVEKESNLYSFLSILIIFGVFGVKFSQGMDHFYSV